MEWLVNKKIVWRGLLLLLFFLAMAGPWMFDRIWVPAEYTCSAPFVRLDENFCGSPLSGFWLVNLLMGVLWGLRELLMGRMSFAGWVKEAPAGLVFLILWLPAVLIFYLLFKNSRRLQVASLISWVLAFLPVLLAVLFDPVKQFLGLWGRWLYLLLVVAAIVLESSALSAGKSATV